MKSNAAVSEQVDRDRWQMAQTWERQHWIRDQKALAQYGKNYIWRLLAMLRLVPKHRGDDRNIWWQRNLDNYSFLPPKVENALEVGCGPYTNMRLIREVCQPDHLFLSDPLIRTYVKFKMTFVNELHRAAACCLDDHPLEQLPFADDYFDLVVMINVLDHVQDARACMESLIRVLKPGGFVVIGQDLTNDEDFRKQPDGLKTGHPITLDENWFGPYLSGNFDTVLHKILPRDVGWAPQWHYGTLVFSGTKRSKVFDRR
jgi:ubiquinone/menaquinone biosynthesis C-methylase UbiE